jgi:hypothetical protein
MHEVGQVMLVLEQIVQHHPAAVTPAFGRLVQALDEFSASVTCKPSLPKQFFEFIGKLGRCSRLGVGCLLTLP